MGYAFTTVELPINRALTPQWTFGSNKAYPPRTYDYYWIVVVSVIAAGITAYANGANDVANFFAPSVGAKTLRLWQACLIAAICEFAGSMLLGAVTADTIKGKIISPKNFAGNDDLLMFGMICSDFGAGLWVLIATRLEINVSSTHSIVGAIVGMSLTTFGPSAVDWTTVGTIIGSWFISPLLTGIIAAGLFAIIRRFVLRDPNSFERSLRVYPFVLFFTISLTLSFILVKSVVPNKKTSLNNGQVVGIAFGVGAGVAILFSFFVTRIIRKRYEGFPDEDPLDAERREKAAKFKAQTERSALADPAATKEEEEHVDTNDKVDKFLAGGELLHDVAYKNEKIYNMHDQAEVFSYRTECVFSLVQIFTACTASFGHGANDVGNAIGPLSTVLAIYNTGSAAAASKVPVPEWVLAYGGAMIVLGLATYGWKLLKAMGVKMVKLTPSRGFAIELATSTVILVGSFLSIPLSTSQCATGAIVAIGLLERRKGAVNWPLFGKMFVGWLVTLFFAGIITSALFAFSTFAPSQYYPLSESNCLYMYGTLYNQTVTNNAGPLQIPLYQGSARVLAGYPKNGQFADIMALNPPNN